MVRSFKRGDVLLVRPVPRNHPMYDTAIALEIGTWVPTAGTLVYAMGSGTDRGLTAGGRASVYEVAEFPGSQTTDGQTVIYGFQVYRIWRKVD